MPRSDRRAEHVLKVLRRQLGDTFDAGVINGPRGKATLTGITPTTITFSFSPVTESPPPPRITLIVGLPRPQTARDVLRDATTLGVGAIHFVATDKAESSYAQSALWSSGEWRRHALAGAEQAFDTRLPEITHGEPLRDVVARLVTSHRIERRIALDNYESAVALYALPVDASEPVVLAVGSERGWSDAERAFLRQSGFEFAHLGSRVLRTETAVVATVALIRAKLRLG